MLRHVPREDMHVPAYPCWFAEGDLRQHTPDKDVSAKCIAQRVAGANESKPIFQEVKNQKMFKSNSLKMQVSTQTQQGNPHNPHLNNAKASCFVIPERFFVRHNLGTNLSHASVKHPSVFNCKLWEENVGMFHRSKKPHLDNIVNKGDSLLSQNHDRILLWLDSTTNKTFQAPHWAHFASLCRKETAVSPAPKKNLVTSYHLHNVHVANEGFVSAVFWCCNVLCFHPTTLSPARRCLKQEKHPELPHDFTMFNSRAFAKTQNAKFILCFSGGNSSQPSLTHRFHCLRVEGPAVRLKNKWDFKNFPKQKMINASLHAFDAAL